MDLDLERIRVNVQSASTEDLLDRVTVYRAGMEPEAVEIIEAELRRRGVTAADQVDHAEARQQGALSDDRGVVCRCSRCEKPAVRHGWGWHWLWGRIPIVPRRLRLCAEHAGARKDRP